MHRLNNVTLLAVVAVLAASISLINGARRGIQTCRCQLQPSLQQQGKLLGRACYVVGVGRCDRFTYIDDDEQQQLAEDAEAPPSEEAALRRLTGTLSQPDDGVAAAVAAASPQQRRREEALLTAGVTARPGSPEAVLAAEKGGDAHSQALGQEALRQIYYLQALLG